VVLICEKFVMKGISGILTVNVIKRIRWREPKEVFERYLNNQNTVSSPESYLAKSLSNRLKDHYTKPIGLIEHEKRQKEDFRNSVYRPEPDKSIPTSIGNTFFFQKIVQELKTHGQSC